MCMRTHIQGAMPYRHRGLAIHTVTGSASGGQRVHSRFGDVALHRLTQSRIHLIRNRHHADQKNTEVDRSQIVCSV